MSYLERIAQANRARPERYLELRVAGHLVGHVRPRIARALAGAGDAFALDGRVLRLAGALDRPDCAPSERTAAVAAALGRLREAGLVPGWRDEPYAVAPRLGAEPLLLVERAALPLLGARGCGVHLNGFVGSGDGMRMWIGRRARGRPGWPGRLDQIVAGGVAAGLGVRETLIKECAEEASIPADLADRARPTGAISYRFETPQGLRPDVLFTYDLELDAGFVPRNADGEVEGFELWPLARVMETVRETTRFKFNCALVAIDFLIRHGFIGPEEPDYLDLVTGLRAAAHGAALAGAGDPG